jgi:multicomponent Na+:H+ antiporter subunit D
MTIAAALLVVWLAAVALVLCDGRRRLIGWIAVAAVVVNLVLLAVLLAHAVGGEPEETVAGGWPAGIGIRLRADALGALFAVLSSGVVLVALEFEVAAGVRSRLLPGLVLFLTVGLTGLFLTADVFSFYVFFELAMIASYALASTGDHARQVGATFVFAVVNLLGSFVFLLGVAALYHVTGALEMSTVAARMADVEPNSAILIAVAFFVAFGIKLGLFPFHFWLPAIYGNAPPAVAAILSGAVANIAAYGLLRFGVGILPAELALGSTVLLALGAASILYGALQAIARRTASEVLAYSAIGQAGYVLVAIAVGGTVGLAAAVVYSIVNALNKTLLFLTVGLRGPLIGAAFAVGALSVTGVPPTAGFFGKVALFETGLAHGGVVVTALLFLGGALSFLYMFQIYQHDFWRGDHAQGRSSPAPLAPVVLVAGVVLVLGAWPEPLLAAGRLAAEALGDS